MQRVSAIAGEGMTLNGIRRIFELEAEIVDLTRRLEQAKRASG